jgi:hypothetical protein
MKSFFACFLCLVFFTSQSYAISGGPFTGPSHIPVTGTYSGIFKPSAKFSPGSNSLGLFTMVIPSVGLADGTVVIFGAGLTYTGTIQASANPDNDGVTGVIDATSTVNVVIGDNTFVETASGGMKAQVKLGKQLFSVRMKGVRNENHPDAGADIQFSLNVNEPFLEVIYDIIGFKQSS